MNPSDSKTSCEQIANRAPLSVVGVKVLDLTDSRGEIAGRLLADLGAEVLKVEPPGGVDSRRLPPVDEAGQSLFWASYGSGKTSVTLDLDAGEDKAAFLALVRGADILIESFDVGLAAAMGIDERVLMPLNSQLIYVALTAYGRQGPKAGWPATSLTLEAAGGRLSIQGDTDRPPLPIGYPQAWLHAGAQAAADALVALNERTHSGLGQFLDLSSHEAMWWTLMGAQGSPVCLGENPPGSGDDRSQSSTHPGPTPGPRIAQALDGLVTIAPGASPPGTRSMFSFAIEEAESRGERNEEQVAIDWDNWVEAWREGRLSAALLEEASSLLDRFIARRTKQDLIEWAMHNNLRLGPLHTTRDLLEFSQFRERAFFDDSQGFLQPSRWVHLSRTPLRRVSPAKHVATPPMWAAKQALETSSRTRSGNAFEGLRVADFSWVAAGPTIAKALADHGATVVKVESATRPDLSRVLAPHIDGQAGLNRSYWSFLYGTSKLSLQCNLSTQGGRHIAKSLCDWADVVIESFSPGTMQRMGIDYETLSASNPQLIMLSTSMLGQTGPYSRYAGFGQQAAGFCGFHYITGWPDRAPCGVATPYTDVVAPKFGIASLAAAIFERHQSGRGQFIDLAQAECSMMFIAPLILDESVCGRTAKRQGFDSMYACPQGVYPTQGIERFVAIATETLEQWRALAALIPNFPFNEPRYDDLTQRREHRASINAAIAAWSSDLQPFEMEHRLIAAGVPASVVQRPLDVHNDPQIEARGHKQTLPHPECGDVLHYGFCTRFSAKSEMIRFAPPCIGEHNDLVLRDYLGFSNREIESFEAEGALD